jgi:hypothetical protein
MVFVFWAVTLLHQCPDRIISNLLEPSSYHQNPSVVGQIQSLIQYAFCNKPVYVRHSIGVPSVVLVKIWPSHQRHVQCRSVLVLPPIVESLHSFVIVVCHHHLGVGTHLILDVIQLVAVHISNTCRSVNNFCSGPHVVSTSAIAC